MFSIFACHYQLIFKTAFWPEPLRNFKRTAMKEKQRILTVIIVVVAYNLIDQLLIRSQRGITISSVVITIVIAVVVYLALIYFFGKKHLN